MIDSILAKRMVPVVVQDHGEVAEPLAEALASPYGHTGVRFIPTGGVSFGNLAAYLKLPIATAIGGSWMVNKQLVHDGKSAEITRITREATKTATACE